MSTPKLYEITAEIRALADEDLSPKDAIAKFQSLTGEFKAKVRGVVAMALELQALAAARKEHATRMIDSTKPLLAKAQSLLDYAQIQIQNVEMPLPLRFPEFTLSLAKMPPKTDVFDEALVPAEYKKTTVSITLAPGTDAEAFHKDLLALNDRMTSFDATTTVSKSSIAADLKEGVLIPGACFEPTTYRLTVK